MEHRVWNFAAGPSVLPEAVLKRAASEMLNWKGKKNPKFNQTVFQ